jgi:hypothetical protein
MNRMKAETTTISTSALHHPDKPDEALAGHVGIARPRGGRWRSRHRGDKRLRGEATGHFWLPGTCRLGDDVAQEDK